MNAGKTSARYVGYADHENILVVVFRFRFFCLFYRSTWCQVLFILSGIAVQQYVVAVSAVIQPKTREIALVPVLLLANQEPEQQTPEPKAAAIAHRMGYRCRRVSYTMYPYSPYPNPTLTIVVRKSFQHRSSYRPNPKNQSETSARG